MSEQTERIIAALRAGTEQYGLAANGMIVRALLDLADQRDELFEALLFARSAILCGDEWTDTCERVINGAIQKVRPADGDD